MRHGIQLYRSVFMIVFFTGMLLSLCYGQFAGGLGTEADPYQVNSAVYLNNVRLYPDKYFVQTADINLNVSPFNSGTGWQPIGSPELPFSGSYHGGGYKILGLYINNPTAYYQGLFGYALSAEFSEIYLEGANLTGLDFSGALIGCAEQTVISNCKAHGSINGGSVVGGLVGSLESGSSLFQCMANATVQGVWSVGGLCGYNKGGGTVYQCKSLGQVFGNNAVGGLLGTQQGSQTTACYSRASVNGVWGLGGLVGVNDFQGSITGCFSTGLVSGSNTLGGLVGRAILANTVSSYWDLQTSGQATSVGGLGRTTDQLSYPYDSDAFVGWGIGSIWSEDTTMSINDGYPYLSWEYTPPEVFDLGITGINLPAVGHIDIPLSYKVDVANYGSNPVESDAYQILLKDGFGNLLHSQAGSFINPGETREISGFWTPLAAGIISVYAQVDFMGDQNPANDSSDTLSCTIFYPPAPALWGYPEPGSIVEDLQPLFSWQPDTGTAFYPEPDGYLLNLWDADSYPVFSAAIGSEPSYACPFPLAWNTGYQWQVIPYINLSDGGQLYASECPVWLFTVAESTGHPVNLGATVQNWRDVLLTWDLEDDDRQASGLDKAINTDRGLQHYNVYRDGVLIDSCDINSYLDAGLNDGDYSYYVEAVFLSQVSEPSNIANVNINTVYPVQNVMAEEISGELQLGWTDSEPGLETGYQVWRLPEGMESDEASWTLVWGNVSENQCSDPQWLYLADGSYLWAVRAVYDGIVFSEAAFSNVLTKVNPFADIAVNTSSIYYELSLSDSSQTELIISNNGTVPLFWNAQINSLREAGLSISPSEGTIQPSSNQNCVLSFAPADTTGTYVYEIQISSNDPDTPILLIPAIYQVYSPIAYIPDNGFRMAINEALGQGPDYQPTIADLNGMSGMLEAYDRGISSIEGAQYLTNIEGLQIDSNQISNLSVLGNLSNLSYLSLSGNQIIDISPLANLHNLTTLQFSNNQVVDIRPLTQLTALNTLNIGQNQISDLSPLSGLVNLQSLDLSFNIISDISAISNMGNLTSFSAVNNQISNVNPLALLLNLQHVQLNLNQISDISALSGLVNLLSLDLNYNPVINIAPLTNLVNLQSLYLKSSQVSDLSPLSGLQNLGTLYLGFSQINNIRPLSSLVNLAYLDLEYNQISDLNALANLNNVEYLTLDGNPLSKESMLLTQSWSLPYVAYEYAAIAPCYPDPERSALDISVNTNLIWEANYDAQTVSFEVYLGTNSSELAFQGMGIAGSDFHYGLFVSLLPDTEYFWRVKAIAYPDTIWSGLWNFTTGDMPEFAGGSGTEADPYQVATAEHLNNVRYHLDAHFIQIYDIDLGVSPWNVGEGWVPIGDESEPFTGVYHSYRSIENLYIDRLADNQGLFGVISSAEISNVVVNNLEVTAFSFVGGIVGTAQSSYLVNCSSQGVLQASGTTVGGIAGNAQPYTTIEQCDFYGTIAGYYGGGIVGTITNGCIVRKCYSGGAASGTNAVGGIVGINYGGTIERCASTVSVNSDHVGGGIVGISYWSSSVNNCYSSGAVSGNANIGGVAGFLDTDAYLSNCYSTGSVSGLSDTGGLVGGVNGTNIFTSYWNIETSGQLTSAAGEGRTTAEMAYPFAANTYVGWDWDSTWAADLDHSVNNGYPYLQWMALPSEYYPPENLIALDSGSSVILNWSVPLTGNPDSYQVWRLQPGQESEEGSWTLVSGMVTDTTSTDPQWGYQADGNYLWAVKASYGAGVFSQAAFSNVLVKENLFADIAVNHSSVYQELSLSDSSQIELVISNNGTAPLIWTAHINSLREAGLSISPSEGTIPPSYNQSCLLSFSPAYTTGTYVYEIRINSNDPDTPLLTIPATYQVYSPMAYIPDDNFRLAINETLGQPADYQPTIADLNGITGILYAPEKNISSIEGAQHLINIQALYLMINQISDLSPLANLTNLQTLYLVSNQISDLSHLQNLTNLQYLYLGSNQIQDLSPLSDLTNLLQLPLNSNLINDLSPLRNLTNLQQLLLNGNQISDLSPLQNLTNMQILWLQNNQISDLNPLRNLTDLQQLPLNNNEISDLSPLVNLLNLTSLNLDSNPLSKESMLLTQSWSLPYVAYEYTAIAPCYPFPTRNSTGVFLDTDLQWQANFNYDIVSYEVWLGTSPDDLSYLGVGIAVADTLFSYSPVLTPYTNYYWQIRAVTATQTIHSGLWHFSTQGTLSGNVDRNLVVVEIGEGTWCTYCVGSALGAEDLLAYEHPVAIINNHYYDSFTNTGSTARNNYYEVTGYPTAYFDGLNASVGGNVATSMYSTYLPKVISRMSVQSSYQISATGSKAGNTISLNALVEKPGALSYGEVVLHCVITESDIDYSWFSQTQVHSVNRLMVPDQNGTAINLATGEWVSVPLSFTWDSQWNMDNAEIVLFVQNNSTKEIMQGIKYPVRDFVPVLLPPTNLVATDQDSEVLLSWNSPLGGTPDSYQVWRLQPGQEIYEDSWALVSDAVTDTMAIDPLWQDMAAGTYKWAVRATYPSGSSAAVFSNELIKANGFAGGSGTEADPYQVATAEHLNNVRNHLDAHFIQTANISLDFSPWNVGSGWLPIGDDTSPFTGFYNGNSVHISDIYINRSESDFQGLFGVIQNAQISNLNVIRANVSGYNWSGIIVGRAYDSSIISCASDGFISGEGGSIGNLAGRLDGSQISGSLSYGDVYGAGYSVGGMVGRLDNSQMSNCFAQCYVTGSGYLGGLAGFSLNGSLISTSYSNGSVSSTENYAGGVTGYCQNSAISSSYSLSSVSGNDYIGGLAGVALSATITDCFTVGSVSGLLYVGGMVGFNAGSSTAVQSYWNTTISELTTSALGEGRTTDEMTYPFAGNTYLGWDWNETWVADVDFSQNSGYPYLQWQSTAFHLIPPSNLTAAYDVDFGAVLLNWDAPPSTPLSYRIYRAQNGLVTDLVFLTEVTAITFGDASGTESAVYAVTAVYLDGESAYSNYAWASRMQPVETTLSIDQPTGNVILRWDLLRDADSYYLYYTADPYAPFPEAWNGPISITDNQYIDSLAQCRFYKVMANMNRSRAKSTLNRHIVDEPQSLQPFTPGTKRR